MLEISYLLSATAEPDSVLHIVYKHHFVELVPINKNVSESIFKQRFGILLTPLSSSNKYMQIT